MTFVCFLILYIVVIGLIVWFESKHTSTTIINVLIDIFKCIDDIILVFLPGINLFTLYYKIIGYKEDKKSRNQ